MRRFLLAWRGFLTRYGVLGTMRRTVRRLIRGGAKHAVHPFDAAYGVETSGLIGAAWLATGHRHDPEMNAYVGIAPSRFRAAMELWHRSLEAADVTTRWTFVDLGCGKGRALLMASERSFREAIGVELNPDLAAAAARNVLRWVATGRAACPVRVVCQDAAEFSLPKGPCVLFLYNAFGEGVVRELAQKLKERVQRGDGPVDVVYQNPQCSAALVQEGGFREVWREHLAMSEEDAAADPVASPQDFTLGLRAALGAVG